MQTLPIQKITPDPTQPRQDFDPEAMSSLEKSVREKGILVPLIVEETNNGTYLIVDGERRYRTAKTLKLKEVPVEIVSQMNPMDRMIMRFHLQDQHSSWSPFDRARAILFFQQNMKLNSSKTAEILGINVQTVLNWTGILTLSKRSQAYAINLRLPFSYLTRITRLVRLYQEICNYPTTEIEMKLIKKLEAKSITNDDAFRQLIQLFNKEESPKRLLKFLDVTDLSFPAFMIEAEHGNDVRLDSVSYRASTLAHQLVSLKRKKVNDHLVQPQIDKLILLRNAISDFIK